MIQCELRTNPRPGNPLELADCNRAAGEIKLLHGRPGLVNESMCQACLAGHWPAVRDSLLIHHKHLGTFPDDPPLAMKRPRIGWALPVLSWGGMERWLVTTLTYLDRSKVDPVGVWLQYGRSNDGRLMAEMDAVSTTFTSLAKLAAVCDIIVFSGIHQPPADLPREVAAVVVAHGEAAWTKQVMAAWQGRADRYVGVSWASTKAIPSGYESTVIANGVDLRRLGGVSSQEAKRRLGVPHSANVLGYVGRLVAEKGIKAIIEALVHLPSSWVGLLVGGGAELGACRVLAHSLGVSDRLYTPGPTLDVAAVYAACDVFAYPSAHEGFALSLVEAWGAGVSCVATSAGVLDEAEGVVGGPLVERVPWPPTGDQVAAATMRAADWFTLDSGVKRARLAAAAEFYSAERSAKAWTDYLLDLYVELPPRDKVAAARQGGGCSGCGS